MDASNMSSLEELLDENSMDGSGMNFAKIRELVIKTASMKAEEKERSEKTEQYFKTLRERIDQSSSYLEKAKKDLDNISFVFEREKLKTTNNMDYEDFLHKTDEEIDAEMDAVKLQLKNLESRMQSLSNNTFGAEQSFEKSIKTLENIGKGVYKEEED